MPLSEDHREIVEAFRAFVEDFVAGDDRYGPVTRHDSADESTLASRFEVGAQSWLEVAVQPFAGSIRVAFLRRFAEVAFA